MGGFQHHVHHRSQRLFGDPGPLRTYRLRRFSRARENADRSLISTIALACVFLLSSRLFPYSLIFYTLFCTLLHSTRTFTLPLSFSPSNVYTIARHTRYGRMILKAYVIYKPYHGFHSFSPSHGAHACLLSIATVCFFPREVERRVDIVHA